jgi:hypothetical protein
VCLYSYISVVVGLSPFLSKCNSLLCLFPSPLDFLLTLRTIIDALPQATVLYVSLSRLDLLFLPLPSLSLLPFTRLHQLTLFLLLKHLTVLTDSPASSTRCSHLLTTPPRPVLLPLVLQPSPFSTPSAAILATQDDRR